MNERDLIEVTTMLGMDYDDWKDAEKLKNHSRTRFFQLATETITDHLGEQTVISYAPDLKELQIEMQRKYPAWKVVEHHQIQRVGDNGTETMHYEVRLKENPELAKFSFLNPNDRKIYTRQVVTGVMMLDDERLAEENPELWDEVSYVPEPKRELRPIEELTQEQVKKLQAYTYMTKPTIKLGAPRNATEEELAEAYGKSTKKEDEEVRTASNSV